MPSDLVSDQILKNSSIGPNILQTNLKFFGSFPFLPKLFKYLYYIIINYSKSIQELKSSNYVFSENLPRKLSETLWKDLESSELLRNYQNIII